MPQEQRFTSLDSIFDKYEEELNETLGANPLQTRPASAREIQRQEMIDSKRLDIKRQQEMARGIERGGPGEFFGQAGAGFLESATIAPTLWEQLGVDVPAAQRALEGQYQGEWEELSNIGKAGYGLGVGVGALIPFGAIGKGVKGVLGLGGHALKGISKGLGRTPWTEKAALELLEKRAGQLTGKAAVKLDKEALEGIVKASTEETAKQSFAGQWANQMGKESFEAVSKTMIASRIANKVPAGAVDEITDLAYNAVTTMSPGNAHAFLSQTIGKIPGLGSRTKVGEFMAAYSYDALIGATMGWARYNAHAWSNYMKQTGVKGSETWGAFRRDHDFHDLSSEMLHEAFWIGWLGPVRMIRGGTSASNFGKAYQVTRRMAGMWKPVERLTAREARKSLKLIDDVSGGALRYEKMPIIEAAQGSYSASAKHWTELLGRKEVHKALKEVRLEFMKRAPGMLVREWGKDMWGSMPRMLVGATTMNLPAIHDLWENSEGDTGRFVRNIPFTWGSSLPEIAVNVMVGMAFTKKGRGLRLYDRPPTEGWFQHADAERWIGGQSNQLKRMLSGMEKVGYTTEYIEEMRRQNIWDNDEIIRYQDGLKNFAFSNSPTYKRLLGILQEYGFDTEAREGDTTLPLLAAYKDAMSKEKDPAVRQRMNMEYEVADNIITNIRKNSQTPINIRNVTESEAVDIVSRISTTKINGKIPTNESIKTDLDVLEERTFAGPTAHGTSTQKSYLLRVLKALGYDTDIKTRGGQIIVPRGIDIKRTKGTGDDMTDIHLNIGKLIKDGERNGWIKKATKGVATNKTPSADMSEEAINVHREITNDMHKMVYGEKWTENADPGSYDGMIISSPAFGISARNLLNLKQSRNAVAILSGNTGNVDATGDKVQVDRFVEALEQVLVSKDIKIINWDKVKDADYQGADAEKEVGQWLKNIGEIHGLLNRVSYESGTFEVDAGKVIELKKKMDTFVGDSFTYERAFQQIRQDAIEYSTMNIGMPGTSYPQKVGVMTLLFDKAISEDGKTLPSYEMVHNFLLTSQKSGTISPEAFAELDLWYKKMSAAIEESGTSVIGLEDIIFEPEKSDTILQSLRHAQRATIDSEHMNDTRNVGRILETIEGLYAKIEGKYNTKDESMTEAEFPTEAKDIDVDQALADHLDNARHAASTLKNFIHTAIHEGNTDLIREVSQRQVDLERILDKLGGVIPSSGYEAYLLELTKQQSNLRKFRDAQLTEEQATEMIDQDLANSTVKADRGTVSEEPIRISAAQFAMKYHIEPEYINDLTRWIKNSKNLVDFRLRYRQDYPELFRKTIAEMSNAERRYFETYELLGEIERDLRVEGDIELTPTELVDMLVPALVGRAELGLETRRKYGELTAKDRDKIEKDIPTDTIQVLQSLVNSKDISVLEFQNGTWDLSKSTVSKFPGGFNRLIDTLGLDGNLYLMSQSAIVDGRKHSFLGPEVVQRMRTILSQNEMEIVSREAAASFMKSGDKEGIERLNRANIQDGNQYTMIALDEQTTMVLRVNAESREAIKGAYQNRNSPFYQRLNDAFELNRNPNIRNIIDEIAGNLHDTATLEKAVLLARLVNDFPTRVQEAITDTGELQLKNTKDLWKRLSLTQPKSGIYGSPENIEFIRSAYEYFTRDENGGHAIFGEVGRVMDRVFAEDLRTWVINDDGIGSNHQSRNSLDGEQIMRARANAEYDQGLLSSEQRQHIRDDAVHLKGRAVADAEWYLSKDRFLAVLGMFGIRESMLIRDNDPMSETFGEILGFKNGGIKPVISLSEVNPDGSMRVFLGKTAFKYDPNMDSIMEAKGVHAITFRSANKLWDTKGARDNGVIQPTNKDNWQRPAMLTKQQMEGRYDGTQGWADVLSGMEASGTIDLPWASMDFKQIAREHIASAGPNTFVHFDHRGQTAAKDWVGLESKMDRFERNFFAMNNDPVAATVIAKQLAGFSVEAGDNVFARTGMDYILQQGGLIVDSWHHPYIEKAMISYYLNGGNMAHKQIYHSSMDVMTAEPGTYDMPVRFKGSIQGLTRGYPVQTRFGGKGISAFLGDKAFTLSGRQSILGGLDRHGEPTMGVVDTDAMNSPAFVFQHSYQSTGKNIKGELVAKGKVMEEGLIFQDEIGGTYLTFRGLMVNSKGDVYRLADMSRDKWRPLEDYEFETSIRAGREGAFTKEFFKELYDTHVGDGSLFKGLVDWTDQYRGYGLTNTDIVNQLNGKNLWMASFSLRQPRNAAGDIIITKIEEVLNRNQGNLEKTNTLDALKHHDADFDFDKNSTFTATRHTIWQSMSRLSGSKIYMDEDAVQRDIMEHFNRNLDLTDNDMMVIAQGDMLEGALVRGRFVKMHQTLTYIRNAFRDQQSLLTFKYGSKVIELRMNESPEAYLNTSENIGKWVKIYIDLYKKTPKSQRGTRFIEDTMWKIWFGDKQLDPNLALFKLETSDGSPIDFSLHSDAYAPIQQIMSARFFRPINKVLTFNRGRAETPEGFGKQATLNQMAGGYQELINSLNPRWKINGWESTGENRGQITNIDINPGLTSLNRLFKTSNAPFDYGMRRLHEIETSKYADVNFSDAGVGALIKSIESGNIDGIDLGSSAKHNKILQEALHHYIKSEPQMVEVIALDRKIEGIKQHLEYLEAVHTKKHAESSQIKAEQHRLDGLIRARDEILANVGLHRDFVQKKWRETFKPVPWNTKERTASGDFTNHNPKEGRAVGVVHRGELIEVIRGGQSNFKAIPKGSTLIEAPRQYVSSTRDNLGAKINFQRFSGPPVLMDKTGVVDRMSHEAWESTRPLPKIVAARLAEIQKKYGDSPQGKELGNREIEKIDAIHHALNSPEFVTWAESQGTLGKWSLIQRLLVPKISKTEMEISPQLGLEQRINIDPKYEMMMNGSIERMLTTYLNYIRTGTGFGTIGSEGKLGLITKAEAEHFLQNIARQKNFGFLEVRNKYGNLDVIAEGMFSADIDINRYHGLQDRMLNKDIELWRNATDKNIREAARILLKYAAGDVLLDPFSLYRAMKVMEATGIPHDQIFGKMIRKEMSGDFGQSMRLEIIHPLDAAGERGRYFGDQSSRGEGAEGMIDRIFRCGRP